MASQLLQNSIRVFSTFILVTVAQAHFVQAIKVHAAPYEKGEERELLVQASDLSLEKIGRFPGEFRDFSPDSQRLVTFLCNEDRTLIFDIDDTELASFLYSIEGEELAVFSDFLLRRRSLDGEMIAIYDNINSQTDLYRVGGCN